MNKHLLLGAEAIALGALDAGISGVYAYPGTPFDRNHRIHSEKQ